VESVDFGVVLDDNFYCNECDTQMIGSNNMNRKNSNKFHCKIRPKENTMNNFDYHRSIALALLVALALAYFGEWLGFSAMVGIALIQTYREHRFRKQNYEIWLRQQKEEGYYE